jgi:DNA-binding response OmpR family regulator
MAVDGSGPRQIGRIFAARGVVLGPQQAILLNALLGCERLVTYRALAEALWGADPEGGPLDARGDIRVALLKARRKISAAAIPWQIENCYGVGYRLRYRDAAPLEQPLAA